MIRPALQEETMKIDPVVVNTAVLYNSRLC